MSETPASERGGTETATDPGSTVGSEPLCEDGDGLLKAVSEAVDDDRLHQDMTLFVRMARKHYRERDDSDAPHPVFQSLRKFYRGRGVAQMARIGSHNERILASEGARAALERGSLDDRLTEIVEMVRDRSAHA